MSRYNSPDAACTDCLAGKQNTLGTGVATCAAVLVKKLHLHLMQPVPLATLILSVVWISPIQTTTKIQVREQRRIRMNLIEILFCSYVYIWSP